ncbi:hypothetical protein IDJ77_16975 [Mucilaginibacter sp. ZT4R22]|uniref:Uncharacterized protein n=1 Tax=Mucilaginibacter pankratovii TaxID=2772110 RepID=A0ABR7WTD2_9SPHI|nr:hypothetical protein [Mucilaginibacter pankratovii]MBD1365511.1 hypothetical protein [Mucilaginibacter pankratovii]
MKVFVPDLPREAKNIDISFYGDDFLGDFSLEIGFTCSIKEKITEDEKWAVKSVDNARATQRVYYSNHME